MSFPKSERVIYRRNPLIEVICQLRFSPILRINAELPAVFQELLRRDYPILREQHAKVEGMPLPPEVDRVVSFLAKDAGTVYEFVSEDAVWRVSLAKDFVALTTTNYERWEAFQSRISNVLDVLKETYNPPFFTRIGLRYQDAIARSELGLENCAWPELLRSEVCGELQSQDVAANILGTKRQVLFKLDKSGGRVRLAHGLSTNERTKEVGYLIDADFYTEQRTEVKDVLGILGSYNRQAGNLFRWCISDRLHHAMEPYTPD
ncbi:hypothetical protein B1C78_00660 [Thioalkalivibrio denitrificans]|uniref:TIGR04255 family protein n=2 Tax=Thioalkalivibrio denitrificans TaxID=108003 RepID=A0A1V3NV71_9GAMM|nr:hypothetical protein B1C78_00660 [Thioalkalivibrio denitrificans]